MKNFISKVQDLGHKAQELKQMGTGAPPKIAELREAMIATASQVHQMRSAVQGAAAGLYAPDEERLIAALHEIDASAATFRAAGYELENVELELSVPQRLIVHLEKISEVSFSTLRSLSDANADRPTTRAILAALTKAEDMENKVTLENLKYHQLAVHIGQVPTARLCWRTAAREPATIASSVISSAAPPAPPVAADTSLFGQSSFFAPASPRVTPMTPHVAEPESAATQCEPCVVEPGSISPSPAPVVEKVDPLARFKKMPDLTRR